MKITAIGCLHGSQPELPGGDLLIITGDLTARNEYQEYILFKYWLDDQKYKRKIFIAGNHDTKIQDTDIIDDVFYEYFDDYLCDSGTEFQGLKIWGSPWSLTFPNMNPHCKSFTVDTEEKLAEKWKLIPDDVHILVTHTPPFNTRDKLSHSDEHVGSKSLKKRLLEIKPKIHVFSHIHEGYGKSRIFSDLLEDVENKTDPWTIDCYNVSIMNERYQTVNKPTEIEL